MTDNVVQRMICSAMLLGLSCVVAACGSAGGSGGGSFTKSASNSAKIDPAIPAKGCGAVPAPAPKDPDGVMASLPASYAANYAGLPATVRKSVWSDFKPNHPPPYKIGVSMGALINGFQTGVYNSIKKELSSSPEFEVSAVSTGSNYDIPQQQQQFSSLMNAKPDLLMVEPLSDAFGPLIDQAAKKGIPTVSFQNSSSSDYSINLKPNTYGTAAAATSAAFRQMGGKGNMLYMHGIGSTATDNDYTAAVTAALKNCPNIKMVGELAGAFVAPTAKAETLKFLATHPDPVDTVVEIGGMAPGIISAFQQSGRPVPLVVDGTGMNASLGFWNNNKDNYHGYGSGLPPASYGASIADVAKRILLGRGLKTSDLVQLQPPITPDNIGEWAKPGWNLKTPGEAEGPPGVFLSPQYVSGLFNDPAPAK